MNEEQAVLDFFAKAENLPLALAVAEQLDKQREQINNGLWLALLQRLNALCDKHQLPWHIAITEDKNAPDSLVGLHGNLRIAQTLYLRPMVEQQSLGSDLRIYFGLMWSTAPSAEHLALPAIIELKTSLQKANFKANESFLAWQWTSFHPRRKDFLLRYSQQPEKTLDEITAILQTLLVDFNEAINLANAALQLTPQGLSASLNQLRAELLD
jgi:hypothetical protein